MMQRTKTALFADVVLGTALTACLAVLAYTMARKAGWADGGWQPGMLIYARAAFLGLVFLGVSLRLRESWRVSLALILLSVAFSIYLAELLLFLAGPDHGGLAGAVRRAGIQFDSRTKFQVVKELRMQGVDAVPAILPHNLFVYDGFDPDAAGALPIAGISGKTTVLCNESGYYAVYMADEHGFNNPRGLHKMGAIDIALIGDSFAHGFCVHPGEDVAGQLRAAGLRALNLGMGGSGPLLELAILTEYAVIYHPKIVLWFYYENDQFELLEEERSPLLRQYLTQGFFQNLRDRQPKVDQVLTDFVVKHLAIAERRSPGNSDVPPHLANALGRLIKLYHLRAFLSERLRTPMTTPLLPPSQQFREVLATAKERVRAVGGQLYFVYLPSLTTFTESSTEYRMHRDQVLSAVRALGIDISTF